MDESSGPQAATRTPAGSGRGPAGGRRLLWSILAVILAFLIGFGWQWYEARTIRAQLSDTQEQLLVERLRVRLGQAALAAQAGEFESARQQMSDFFTRISDSRASLPDSISAITDGFMEMRDDVITGLSRSNPAYAGILYGMLESFRRGTPPTPPATPAPSDTGAPAAPAGADTGVTTSADSVTGG